MDAPPDAVHGLGQSLLHLKKLSGQCLILSADHRHGAYLKEGSGQQVPHVVMDLPGDPVALVQGRQPHLVILFLHQLRILLFQVKRLLPGRILRPEINIHRILIGPGPLSQKKSGHAEYQGRQKQPDLSGLRRPVGADA